jgi:hypothetical protein
VLTVIGCLLFIAIIGRNKIIRPKITCEYDEDDHGVNAKKLVAEHLHTDQTSGNDTLPLAI